MAFTERQLEAIEYSEDKNLLVAAAAGSGKTTVMVERVIRLVLSGQADINQILAVTFTNAAAASMKSKIVEELRKRIAEDAEQAKWESVERLKKELGMVQEAAISTFDSFAQRIVKENFQILNVDPGARVIDAGRAEILRNEILDELISERLKNESSDSDFIRFLNAYSDVKSFETVKSLIVSIYNRIMALPDPFEALDRATKVSALSEQDFVHSSAFKALICDLKDQFDEVRVLTQKEVLILKSPNMEPAYEKLSPEINEASQILDAYHELYEAVSNNGDIMAALDTYIDILALSKKVTIRISKSTPQSFRTAYEDNKQALEESRKWRVIIKEIYDTYFYQPISDSVFEIQQTHASATVLAELVKEFDCRYMEAKKEKNSYDFGDFMHMALEALREERVAARYRADFKYIFVDEYQDSNELQDALISALSTGGNVFMVGDVKQSIYRFRQAEPALFMEKYDAYKKDGKGRVIDLNANFRSKGNIIDLVNCQFEAIMENYDDDARLNVGVPAEVPFAFSPSTEIIDLSAFTGDEVVTETELEARNIVNMIKTMVPSKVRYKDIAILARSTKSIGSTYKKVFEEAGIPVYVEEEEGYFDSMEVEIILNLLRVIDNTRQDIPLLSVLSSPIFNFTHEELAWVRTVKNGRGVPFYDAFFACAAGEGGAQPKLIEKCAAVKSKIEKWRKDSAHMPMSDFIRQLYRQTGFYIYAGALAGGEQRQGNLRLLADKATAYAQESSGIYGFVREIDGLVERKVRTAPAGTLGEDADAVRMMTIHKSKGLEFPVVILASAQKQLSSNNSEENNIIFHKSFGMALKLTDPALKWKKKPLLYKIIKRQSELEEKREYIRLLYVAYTRAIDQLIISATVKNYSECRAKWDEMMPMNPAKALDKCDSMLDWAMTVLPSSSPDMKVKIIPKDELTGLQTALDEEETADVMDFESEIKVREEIAKRLSFEYPHALDIRHKSKYSVTELNAAAGEEYKHSITLTVPSSLAEMDGSIDDAEAEEEKQIYLTAGEKGTIYHLVMEHMDYADLTACDPYDTMKKLISKGLISEHEAEQINLSKISEFLSSPLAERMSAAAKRGRLYKETPFTLKAQKDGSDILVQGIIDCFFEEEGEYVLVDYKSNRTSGNPEADRLHFREIYQEQIDLYARAIEELCRCKVRERYLFLLSSGQAISL